MSVVNELATINGSVTNETLYTNGFTHGEIITTESTIFSQSIYGQRMFDYWPKVISSIMEFRAIAEAEYPEIEALYVGNENILNDAYFTTMGEERIASWEKILGIAVGEDSTVDDRRDVVIARIRGQGKLNSVLINNIVNAFTGGTATSWVEDGVLHVEIIPPPNNKQYKFDSVKNELSKKIPAHLSLNVFRNYLTWGEVEAGYPTWGDVETTFGTWGNVEMSVKV